LNTKKQVEATNNEEKRIKSRYEQET